MMQESPEPGAPIETRDAAASIEAPGADTPPPAPSPPARLRGRDYALAIGLALAGSVLGILGAVVQELRGGGLLVIFVGAPIIEEALKPTGVYILLVKWPRLVQNQLWTACLCALFGVCFGVIESTLYVQVYHPHHSEAFVVFRYTLNVVAHGVFSFIVGLGVNRGLIDSAEGRILDVGGSALIMRRRHYRGQGRQRRHPMKLVLFNDYRVGVIREDRVVDVTDVLGTGFRRPQDKIDEAILRWDTVKPRLASVAATAKGVALDSVKLRPPVPRPGKLLCAAANYLEFGQISRFELDAFLKSPSGIIGSGDTCELPAAKATIFHHEAELAFVIGTTARRVSQSEALSHVFGYCHFIDMSARGINPEGRQSFFWGKSWDTFGPMGPALVTADEIPDPHKLQVRLWNNGDPRHDYPTSDMGWKIPELISEISKVMTLEPGDVISTGTNHQQIGAVQDGDTLRMEISGLGPPLVVHIKDPLGRKWPRGIDKEMAARVVAMKKAKA